MSTEEPVLSALSTFAKLVDELDEMIQRILYEEIL